MSQAEVVVLVEALPLAFAGAFYPLGFVVVIGYLTDPEPSGRAHAFLAGAATTCLLAAGAVFAVVRGLDLGSPKHHTPSGLIQLGLGVGLLIVAVWAWNRRNDQPAERALEPNRSRIRAFMTGAFVYLPGLCFLASIKVVATANSGLLFSLIAIGLCTVAVLTMIEVPVLAVLLFPDAAAPRLGRASKALRANNRLIVAALATLVGAYLVVRGIFIATGRAAHVG
jgi:hypothetical protein